MNWTELIIVIASVGGLVWLAIRYGREAQKTDEYERDDRTDEEIRDEFKKRLEESLRRPVGPDDVLRLRGDSDLQSDPEAGGARKNKNT